MLNRERLRFLLWLPLFSWSCGLFGQSADILVRMNLKSYATIEREIVLPMPDEIQLSTAGSKGRLPVILIRTQYDYGRRASRS